MRKRLPSLSALKAFESVARQLSFTGAARELHVTPGAVSQQVRALEEHVGHSLFDRSRKAISLTPAGMAILPEIQAGFECLYRAIEGNGRRHGARTLSISVAPSLASKWLMPRLGDFSVRFPEIELRISATIGLADFRDNEVDVAIRFGSGGYDGLMEERLFRESLCPMCSPTLAKGRHSLRVPGDLRHFPLIHDLSIPGEHAAWSRWLERAGARQVDSSRGTRFSLAELALQAAIDGSGVVLGRTALAERDVAEGRLIRPFHLELPISSSYYLVMPRENAQRPEIQCFRGWLFDAVEQKKHSRHGQAGAAR